MLAVKSIKTPENQLPLKMFIFPRSEKKREEETRRVKVSVNYGLYQFLNTGFAQKPIVKPNVQIVPHYTEYYSVYFIK